MTYSNDTSLIPSIPVSVFVQRQVATMAFEGAWRATPSIIDGLKLVQRRVLWAMYNIGLNAKSSGKKSATVVGETLGKYHPHGDQAVYQTLVRLAQPWSTRYPLIEGIGNFGSIAGDEAAAMRYTEAKLTEIGDYMLAGIREGGFFVDNEDGSTIEPFELRPRLPMLLLLDVSGISHAAQSASWPSHNIKEVINAVLTILDTYGKPVTTEQIMKSIKGPDLPIGGILYRKFKPNDSKSEDAFLYAYEQREDAETLVHQPFIRLTKGSGGQVLIEILTPPYQSDVETIRASLERIQNNPKLPQWERSAINSVSSFRNSSHKGLFKVEITLKRGAPVKDFLRMLFARRPIRGRISVKQVALTSNIHDNYADYAFGRINAPIEYRPEVFTLAEYLHRFATLRMIDAGIQAASDIRSIMDRLELLKAEYAVASNKRILDAVVKIVKNASSREEAAEALKKTVKIDRKPINDRQASHILSMSIWRLSRLSVSDMEKGISERERQLSKATELVLSQRKRIKLIKKELEEAKQLFGDSRRTLIVNRLPGTIPLLTDDSDPELVKNVGASTVKMPM